MRIDPMRKENHLCIHYPSSINPYSYLWLSSTKHRIDWTVVLFSLLLMLYGYSACHIHEKLYVYNNNIIPSYPSCLQTTVVLLSSQESSQTVPHWLSMQTSTLPSCRLRSLFPFTRRTLPGSHTSCTPSAVNKMQYSIICKSGVIKSEKQDNV